MQRQTSQQSTVATNHVGDAADELILAQHKVLAAQGRDHG